MIYVFDQRCRQIAKYKSQIEVAENLDVNQSSISKAINGKLKYIKDFIVFKAKSKPIEHFFEHCKKYEIPYYNTFYVVTSTIDNSPIWYALNLQTLQKKLNLKREELLSYIVDYKIYDGKRIIVRVGIMPEFDKLL